MRVERYDSIIIGAGHNGLVCAAYLARGGQRVLVLEAADTPGGLAGTREFHPGFHAAAAHSVNHFASKIAADLNLASHGYQSLSQPLAGLNADGDAIVVANDSISGTGARDSESYAEYLRLMRRCAAALEPSWLKKVPPIGSASVTDLMSFAQLGLKLRMLGKDDMREFMRIATLPTRDLMDEFFENDILKATLAWDGLVGARMAPRSPNSSVLAMMYRMSGESASVAGLVKALQAAAESAGAEIRCGARVENLLIEAGAEGIAATGVRLANGEEIAADRVVSSADPKTTFLSLAGVQNFDIGFTNRIRRLRCNGYVAKLHLALDGLPSFNGLDQPNGRLIIAPELDAIEFAFDDAKYGESSANPVMEIAIPSLQDASLAPDGQHVLSAHVMYVPYERKGGWTDDARTQIHERAIETITRYAPDIRDQILHSEFLTPADLEREYRVTGGHWHHTEFAVDQMLMMRPTYEAAQYSTPIPGLYLCGAGCHPGGDLTGAAGHNAAQEVLR
jgi:phytoene dehydrogenase-like protein